jgi:hypothetical protein
VRRAARVLPAALAVAAASLLFCVHAGADQAAQLRPIDLRVAGGEENWHADNDFRLDWDRSPVAEQSFPVTAVDYRVRDAAGTTVIPETRLPWDVTQIQYIHIPSPIPGVYTADVRLEGPGGVPGPWVSAALRFDDVRPAAAQPLAPAGWVAGNAPAVVRLEHAAGPLPVSGIRGYAVSVDGGAPCARQDRCDLAETDLHSGIDGDTISFGLLPEGDFAVRAVAVSGAGLSSSEVRQATVRVDATLPEVALAGAPPGWADGPVRLAATASDALSGMAAGGPNGAFTAIALDGGVPRVAEGGSVTATAAGEGAHTVAFYARDGAGNSGEGSPRTATVRIDESPPSVAFSNRQDPAEPELIEVAVTDPLSGPGPRGSIAVRRSGSRQRFEPLPTAAASGRLVAHWDSDAFPPGSYEFRATGYDGAGNVTSSDRRANGTRMVLANPLKPPTRIEAGFRFRPAPRQQALAASRAIPYGRGVELAGRLSLTSGARLGGLPVEVVETFGAGSKPTRRTSTVETGDDGAFVVRLAPGPGREVEARFAGSRLLGRSSVAGMRLKVAAGVRLRASASAARVGGPPVVFDGRVGALGASIPAAGRPVELQFRFPGSGWSEFRTVQTDSRGRFRYSYAFSDDDSRGVRFQFRAFAPSRGDWPYEPAGSKPVSVVGR